MFYILHWTYTVLFYDAGIIHGIGATLDDFEAKMKKMQNRGSGAPPSKVNQRKKKKAILPKIISIYFLFAYF